MSDSNGLDALKERHDRNREQRIRGVKRWAEYIKENPPESWGAQQNKLVNTQLKSARDSGLGARHYLRIKKAGKDGRR